MPRIFEGFERDDAGWWAFYREAGEDYSPLSATDQR
jgi:hypothetical protein